MKVEKRLVRGMFVMPGGHSFKVTLELEVVPQGGKGEEIVFGKYKLTAKNVKEILHRHSIGESPTVLAKMFGATQQIVWHICNSGLYRQARLSK